MHRQHGKNLLKLPDSYEMCDVMKCVCYIKQTLAAVVFFVNLPHIVANTFLVVLLGWIFLTLSVAITSFMAAYLESRGVAVFTLFILALTILYWLIISIIPIITSDSKWLINLCLNQRCGESLWLMAINYHGVNYVGSYNGKSSFMSGDPFVSDTSLFAVDSYEKDNDGAVGSKNKSIGHSKIDVKNLSAEHLSSEFESKIYPGNEGNQRDEKEEKNKTTVTFSYVAYGSSSKWQANKGSIRVDDEIVLDEENTLPLSQNLSPMLHENEVMVYYDYPKETNDLHPSLRSSSVKLISIVLLLINLTFFIYAWIVIYSYWRAVSRAFRDTYPTSNFGDTDSISETTTK